jgi:hypothetical protein
MYECRPLLASNPAGPAVAAAQVAGFVGDPGASAPRKRLARAADVVGVIQLRLGRLLRFVAVASRKEQKAAVRREREERARRAAEAERRKRIVGYGVGGALALAVIAILVAVMASTGSGGDGGSGSFPSGGDPPAQRLLDLREAVRASGCELESFPGEAPEHTTDPNERIDYNSNPPTNGKHFQEPVDDGAYARDPGVTRAVHALEHGRVIWWFRPTVGNPVKADLKALFDEDDYQLVLAANAEMPYAVAASAWNVEPDPNGTGRLLGCPRVSDETFDALRAFRDEHRGNGLEPVP